jgi:hypothetical protein
VPETDPSDDSARESQRAHARQKRLAVGAAGIFALGVVATVLASWPGPCDRAAKRICEAAWAEDCTTLRSLIHASADESLCTQQLEVLSEIDSNRDESTPRSYLYLAVIKTLIGTHKYEELEVNRARSSAK